MLDSIYKSVQELLNKDQLGYFKPLSFNLFIGIAVTKVYTDYLTDLKSNVRKANWMLDGKNLANFSQHTKQLLEYFSAETPIAKTDNFVLPSNCEFVEDVFANGIRVDKVDYSDFQDLQTNIYAKPKTSSPICSKLGNSLKVSPSDITSIDLHYLRTTKMPKWTFQVVDGKAMFDPTASDFQDVDMPKSAKPLLISLVTEMASIQLRELNIAQLQNQDQAQEEQNKNKQ